MQSAVLLCSPLAMGPSCMLPKCSTSKHTAFSSSQAISAYSNIWRLDTVMALIPPVKTIFRTINQYVASDGTNELQMV